MNYNSQYKYICRHCGDDLNRFEVSGEFCTSCDYFNIDEDKPIEFSVEVIPIQYQLLTDTEWLNQNQDLSNQLKLFEE